MRTAAWKADATLKGLPLLISGVEAIPQATTCYPTGGIQAPAIGHGKKQFGVEVAEFLHMRMRALTCQRVQCFYKTLNF